MRHSAVRWILAVIGLGECRLLTFLTPNSLSCPPRIQLKMFVTFTELSINYILCGIFGLVVTIVNDARAMPLNTDLITFKN